MNAFTIGLLAGLAAVLVVAAIFKWRTRNRPMSVRISAHDWVPGGLTPEDAAEVAQLFKDGGADVIDCSSGQVSKAERPVYGGTAQNGPRR